MFFGPQYVYDKGKDASGEKYIQYLHEVDPGQYTYYGPIDFTVPARLSALAAIEARLAEAQVMATNAAAGVAAVQAAVASAGDGEASKEALATLNGESGEGTKED